jgi:hypothetical protein
MTTEYSHVHLLLGLPNKRLPSSFPTFWFIYHLPMRAVIMPRQFNPF